MVRMNVHKEIKRVSFFLCKSTNLGLMMTPSNGAVVNLVK